MCARAHLKPRVLRVVGHGLWQRVGCKVQAVHDKEDGHQPAEQAVQVRRNVLAHNAQLVLRTSSSPTALRSQCFSCLIMMTQAGSASVPGSADAAPGHGHHHVHARMAALASHHTTPACAAAAAGLRRWWAAHDAAACVVQQAHQRLQRLQATHACTVPRLGSRRCASGSCRVLDGAHAVRSVLTDTSHSVTPRRVALWSMLVRVRG